MKRLTLFALLTCVLLLAGCLGGGADDETTANETTANETTTAETTSSPVKETTTAAKKEEPSRVNEKDPDFFILYTEGEVDYTDAPKAYVDIYKWGDAYTPTMFAQAVFKEGDGFYIRLECEETDPRAVYSNYNDPIYEDSCMEFFAIYKPERSSKYINIEMNANAAYLCYLCDSINATNPIDKFTDSLPELKCEKTDTSWILELHVPVDMLDDVYGGDTLTEGDSILMNIYKCGDKTHTAHYGSWAEVDSATPNFHVPKSFCEVEIRKP